VSGYSFIEKNHKAICKILKSEDLSAEFFVEKNLGSKKYFQIIKKKYNGSQTIIKMYNNKKV